MPPHWARIARLEAMARGGLQGPHRFVAVLDSDAAFTNSGFPLRRLLGGLPAEKSVFIAKDPAMHPPPADLEETGIFCSGFVCVRLSPEGLGFLAAWRDAFDASEWHRDADTGGWSTTARWAGPAYEQGQLNRLARGDFQDDVLELPQALFNSAFARGPGGPQPVVVHLMRRPGEAGGDKDRRVEATLRALWEEQLASPLSVSDGGGFRPSPAGLPTTGADLAAWEAAEEACGP